jgi:hypothetical protein
MSFEQPPEALTHGRFLIMRDCRIGDMIRRQGIWAITGADVIEWYQQHPPAA